MPLLCRKLGLRAFKFAFVNPMYCLARLKPQEVLKQRPQEEHRMTDQDQQLPLLPLRDVVVYPNMVLPLFVGRERSIEALEHAMQDNKQVLLVAQRNAADDEPGVDDLYQVGTVSNILQLLKLPDGTIKVLVEGGYRAPCWR